MARSNQSPVMGYKIALVNGANLNQQYVEVPGTAKEEVKDEAGNVTSPAIPAKLVKQFENASKRQPRAIRKARKMMMAGHKAVMLFGQRENGEHFPVSIRKTREHKPMESRPSSRLYLSQAMPGRPIEEQVEAMTLYRISLVKSELLVKKEA
jgi:hypothetical protein